MLRRMLPRRNACFLNPQDLVLVGRFLGFSDTYELFEHSYLVIDYERNNAPLPRIRFSLGPAGCCPFLENRLIEDGPRKTRLTGQCRLHSDSKPLVCLLAPFCRVVDTGSGREDWGFLPPLQGCPGCGGNEAADLPGWRPPENLKERLDAETVFFRELEKLLEAGTPSEVIIDKLYHIDI